MQDLKKSISKKSKTLKGEPLLSPAKRTLDNLPEGGASLNSLEDSSLQPDESLRRFLATLDIEMGDVVKLASEQGQDPEILIQSLQVLFDNETAQCARMKWATLDHLIEKVLQWPFLSAADIGDTTEKCIARAKLQQRSILLKKSSGLMKAYGIRGFVKGVEFTLANSVHYFVYAMLTYRLVDWVQTGRPNFEEFQHLFNNSSQRGIDTLVHVLSNLEATWLKLILSAPALVGVGMGIKGAFGSKKIDDTEIQAITSKVNARLKQPSHFCQDILIGSLVGLSGLYSGRRMGDAEIQALADSTTDTQKPSGSFCHDTLQERLPVISHLWALSSKIQKLEQVIRWDGRLSHEKRLEMFHLVHRVAREGHQTTQRNAMECLAKIAHGIGFQDLEKLQKSGYKKEDFLAILYIKTVALQDLIALTEAKPPIDPSLHWWQLRSQFDQRVRFWPRRVYASYLLWWLGVSTSFLKQKLPFSAFKSAKLTVKLILEIYFLIKIVESIVTAINCPDKPGFKFADGYADWASDYTKECFTTRMSFFRSINPNESMEALISEITKYHLADLEELSLQNLNAVELHQFIHSILKKAPHIQSITIKFDNQLDAFKQGTFHGLSQLQVLDLSRNSLKILSEDTFQGLSQLKTLDLSWNVLTTLPDGLFRDLKQLKTLWLNNNQLTTLPANIFQGLSQLRTLYLDRNQLMTLSNGLFQGLGELDSIWLNQNQLSTLPDGMFQGLGKLRTLFLQGNQFTLFPVCVYEVLGQLTGIGLNEPIITMDILSQLIQIKSLALSGLTVLPVDTFKNLSQLRYLYLNNNQLSTLPDGVFQNLSQLQSLYLFNNQLTTLPKGIFQGLDQLKLLYLYSNQLNILPDGIFQNLSRLNQLHLNDNQLNMLPASVFQGLTRLQKLILNDNQLNALPHTLFQHLGQLQELDLSSNQLNDTDIITLAKRFPYYIRTLYIDDNFISDKGIEVLVQILPCSNLKTFSFFPSKLAINGTSLLVQTQRTLLEKACSDRLCHANLPSAASCPGDLPSNSIDIVTDLPTLLRNSIWASDQSYDSTYFPSYSSAFSSNKAPLTLPSAASTQNDGRMATAASSATLIGSVGLGILLYKNCTLLQSVVHTGWGFVQQCFYGKKEQQQAAPAESEESSAHSANLGTQTKRSSICSVVSTFFFNKPKTSTTQINSTPEVRQPSIRV